LHTVSTDPASEAVIQVTPGLLRRGEVWSFEGVFGGEPVLSIESPLIDTEVVTVSSDPKGEALIRTTDLLIDTFPIPPLRPLLRALLRKTRP
jgi:hypothetical protein